MILATIVLVALILLMLSSKIKKRGTPKPTEQQRRTDELISVILPTIKDGK